MPRRLIVRLRARLVASPLPLLWKADFEEELLELELAPCSGVRLVGGFSTMSLTLDELLVRLHATASDTVTIGRMQAVAGSADGDVAAEHMRELQEHPKFFAQCGRQRRIISREEYSLLAANGAKKSSELDP